MSEFSRETLINIIETDHVQCGEASALARMALAAMGSEPHTDDELSNLLWYSQEATCHSDPNYYCEFQRLATPGLIAGIIRELQERRKPLQGKDLQGVIDALEHPAGINAAGKQVVRHALVELQERRNAERDSNPVGWTDEAELRDVEKDGCGYLFKANPITPHADPRRVILLYRHAQPASEREQVRSAHAEWSQATFGNVGPVGPLKHLSKEALEAAEQPGDLSEWADMQFLLWDAQRRAGITDDQITQAMIDKLAVNKQREWPEPKDGEPRLHIKSQPATQEVHDEK